MLTTEILTLPPSSVVVEGHVCDQNPTTTGRLAPGPRSAEEYIKRPNLTEKHVSNGIFVNGLTTVEVHPADVGFVMQHPVDGARAPAGASGWR
jgi:hypothetical protein